MARMVSIKAGSKIKIPASLLEQYENEWQIANQILREKRMASKGPNVRQGDNRYSLTFRHSDISQFKRKKDLLRYIRTTHEIVTGKYFLRQVTQYRGNLLRSALKNFGVPVEVGPVTAFTLNQYDAYLSAKQKDILVVLATMSREEIATLEQLSDVNLTQYLYLPEQYQQEHEETLVETINEVYSRLYGQENAFADIQSYRRSKGL